MQAQLLSLEDEKKALHAKIAQEQEQLQAAIAQHKVLSDQMKAVTKTLEQKCTDEVRKADQRWLSCR